MSRPFAKDHDEPLDHRNLDYFPPGEPWNNGTDTRVQKRFELIPFDKIAFDTTPAYLVKGLIPRVGLCVFWGPPKCGKSFLVFDLLMHVALAAFSKGPLSIAHLRVKLALEIAWRRSGNAS
jgi:hypothetical protein